MNSLLIPTLIVAFLIVLGLTYFISSSDVDKTAACEARGGVVLQTRGPIICVDPKIFK